MTLAVGTRLGPAGGTQPRWRRDGKELFYLAPDGTLMAVDVRAGATFEADVGKPLFRTGRRDPISAGDLYAYDVSLDGERFLVNVDVGEASSSTLNLVLDWTEGLRAR